MSVSFKHKHTSLVTYPAHTELLCFHWSWVLIWFQYYLVFWLCFGLHLSWQKYVLTPDCVYLVANSVCLSFGAGQVYQSILLLKTAAAAGKVAFKKVDWSKQIMQSFLSQPSPFSFLFPFSQLFFISCQQQWKGEKSQGTHIGLNILTRFKPLSRH